ncbi:hypothetical protein D3C87_1955920 [compost metagenome]
MLSPGLHFGGYFWLPAVVFTGGSDRPVDLAFLEFTAPVVVAVGGSQHDATARERKLGAVTLRPAPDADAK